MIETEIKTEIEIETDTDTDTITINELKKHDGVKKFIDKVLVQIYTQDEALAIEDELLDHLFSLTQDYKRSGFYTEAAISKALLQMGDPSEIGYSFTDFEGAKKRRLILITMKVISIFVLISTILITSYVVSSNESIETNQNSFQNELSTSASDHDLNIFERITVLFSKVFDKIGPFMFYIIYIPMILYSNGFQSGIYALNGIPIQALDINIEPLLILWPYKKRFPWEYMMIAVFFVPILIIFLILFVYEGSNPFNFFLFFFFIGVSGWMFVYSEKFRIPKYVVLEAGILVKNFLITWASIDKITWSKDYMSKNELHYKLIIENVVRRENSLADRNNFTTKKVIDVNKNQFIQLSALLKERI